MFSRIAFALALAAVLMSGYGLHTARDTARQAMNTDHITRDAAVDPTVVEPWENPNSPWKVAARGCKPEARELLDTWRVVAMDRHDDGYWRARLLAEFEGCDTPKVQYAGYSE